MKKCIPVLIVFLIMLGSCKTVSPISSESALWCTTVATCLTAASSVAFTKVQQFDIIPSILFVGGVTVLVGLCFKSLFFNMTPDARIRRAAKILQDIGWDPLFDISMNCHDDPQMLIYRIYEEYFDSALPLIDAFDKFVYMRSLLNDAHILLDAARRDGVEYRIVDSYQNYCENIDEYRRFIDNALVAIKQDPSWIESINAVALQETCDSQERLARAAEESATASWSRFSDRY